MGGLSPVHWLIVLVVVLILFGAKRLPDAARGVGRSLRIFKSEMGADQAENKDAQAPAPRPAEPPAVEAPRPVQAAPLVQDQVPQHKPDGTA
ncbi:twin-arginine translocase TatA/TatE family subunit [Solihabitans fulvus]|uniref:Sec-independent protein translocase protein TatA n=1 Tax=Solihabitans fulvus TaxID=1892852 RepID=A0A5B2WQ91_9PSEU|nr:Sec-independent protein translocase subunit TatA [Solihabitans fulvus]KAA2252696.1 twin-arginine translocase TatA/TatE family subunit [Solihabitans fulvus]